jgi:hypothetical protein
VRTWRCVRRIAHHSGSTLILGECSSTNPLQQLVIKGSSVATPDDALCVTYVGSSPTPLTLEPCVGSTQQTWTFTPSNGVFEGTVGPSGACLAWNAQGGPNGVRVVLLLDTSSCHLVILCWLAGGMSGVVVEVSPPVWMLPVV